MGAVALWPVLLAGIAFPKVAAFVLALIPVPGWVSDGALRILWMAFALLVPLAVGVVMQRREGLRKWGWRNVLAGFPLTAGLSAAFSIAFFALPFQKLRAAMRGQREEHITLIVDDDAQEDVAREIRIALDADGLAVQPHRPPWMARMIAGILRRTAAVVGRKTSGPLFFRGPDLELTIYPHGATVRGLERAASRAHAVIASTATRTSALQTTDASAQKLERRIKAAWQEAGAGRARAAARDLSDEIARSVSRLDCPYEDWEIVYRQCLQLGLALRGVADPVGESSDARLAQDPLERRRSRRLARKTRLPTKEKAVAIATRSVGKLAEKVAERVFARR